MAEDGIQRFLAVARGRGLELREVRRFDAPTRTSREAARALGCDPGAVVKSLVFLADGTPVMVLVGGDRRVDLRRLAQAVGAETVAPAPPERVREVTGYPVGAVPPLVESPSLTLTVMDRALERWPEVWTSAGSDRSMAALAPTALARASRALRADLGTPPQASTSPAKRVFSGIQPTGVLHVGNYSGALRQFVRLQYEAECLFCVVDLHALTVPHDPAAIGRQTRSLAALYLAAGIDPDRAILFVQSHVPAHSELCWLLNCVATTGELARMTQYKEKGRGRQSVSVGLYDYPVLMAADILAYGATHVPVGDDQRQHVELTRDLAERFNRRYGPTFVVPEAMIPEVGARIMALDDPTRKMSKSAEDDAGRLGLLDPPDAIRRKIMRAVTDSGREVRYDPVDRPALASLLTLYSVLAEEPIEVLAERYAGKGYGEFKKDLAEVAVERLRPLRERHDALMAEPEELDRLLLHGAERAEALAAPTLAAVRERLGLMPRPRPAAVLGRP